MSNTPSRPTQSPLSNEIVRAAVDSGAEAANASPVAPPPAPDPAARRIVDGTKAELETWKRNTR